MTSFPATIDLGLSSFRSSFGWAAVGFVASLAAACRLVGRLELGTVIFTSGTPDFRSAGWSWSGTGLGESTEIGRGGAGTTLVIPSGSSGDLACVASCRNFSPAPPGLGLKADAAVAAFQKAPAISPLDFFDLIIGPRPGRESSTGSGAGSTGDSVGVSGAADGVAVPKVVAMPFVGAWAVFSSSRATWAETGPVGFVDTSSMEPP